MENRQITVDSRLLGDTVSQILAQGGSFLLTVTGNSMRPTLVPGRDQVELTAPGGVKPGDILFFRRDDGSYILHRLLRGGDVLTVNGDSQSWTETVRPSQVVGVVSRILRNGRWIAVDSLPMRLYSRLWPVTRSVRPVLIRAKNGFRK